MGDGGRPTTNRERKIEREKMRKKERKNGAEEEVVERLPLTSTERSLSQVVKSGGRGGQPADKKREDSLEI